MDEEAVPGPCLMDEVLSPGASDDYLREILLRLSDVRTLTCSCPLVSQRWLSLTLDPSFWIAKCKYNGVTLPPVHLFKEYSFDFKRIFIKRPYDRNLIRNPSGEEQFNNWKILKEGGNRWVIERPPVSCDQHDFPIAFATSYDWCVKEQRVDLVAAGVEALVLDEVKPKIIVSEWIAARLDCASEYKLNAWLCVVNEKGFRRNVDEREATVSLPQWGNGEWQKVEIVFDDYPKGTREIILRSSGKDSQFWAGHYGCKMAKASVTVVFD